MANTKRGPDRRRGEGAAVFPLRLKSGEVVERDRRVNRDRRRNAYISQQELCRGLPYELVESVFERCPVRELAAGETLLKPAQKNHYLFLLLTGSLRVHLAASDFELGFSIAPGQCVGEMSIIDGKPTSAYVTATETSTVMAVAEDMFWSKIAPLPGAARNLLRVLAERMRVRNDVTLRALEQELRYQHLQRELDAAHDIQVGMLPSQEPLFPQHPAVDVHAHMGAAREVGGDFYDAFSIDDTRICLAVGDVSGKGMPAAMFMVRTLSLLRVELVKDDDLGDSIAYLNNSLCETNTAHMFVSLFVMILDVVNGELSYVNAGHNPPLKYDAQHSVEMVDMPDGLIAGVMEDSVYEVRRQTLQPGEGLLLYTDGVTEARNSHKEFYTLDRLRRFMSKHNGDDAAATVKSILAEIEEFAGEEPQADDITVLAMRYLGPDQ